MLDTAEIIKNAFIVCSSQAASTIAEWRSAMHLATKWMLWENLNISKFMVILISWISLFPFFSLHYLILLAISLFINDLSFPFSINRPPSQLNRGCILDSEHWRINNDQVRSSKSTCQGECWEQIWCISFQNLTGGTLKIKKSSKQSMQARVTKVITLNPRGAVHACTKFNDNTLKTTKVNLL